MNQGLCSRDYITIHGSTYVGKRFCKETRTDRELQHISVALYQYMCQHVVGLEETVKTKRLIMAIRDNLSYDESRTYITSGSFGEGLEMKGSDFDFMIVLNKIEVHENPLDIKWYPLRTYFTVVTDNTKLGFVKLLLLYSQIDCYTNLCVEYEQKLYLSNQRIKYFLKRKVVNDYITNYLTEINHGPCLSDKEGWFDWAICVHMRSWINEAKHWVTRANSSWPSDDVKSNIIQHGVLLVPVGVKGSPLEEIEWRISFSVGEKLLINSFTHTQLLCYALMKICLKDIINQNEHCKDLLCSYFIKNIIFWVSEETTMRVWKPCNLLSCFMRCFKRLIYCVEYSICPHYFIPENNMFENKIEGQSRKMLLKKLSALYDQDWKFILYSPQLQDFLRIPCIRYTESQLFIRFIEQINLSDVFNPFLWSTDIKRLIKEFPSYISPKIKSYYRYCLSVYSQDQAYKVSLGVEKGNNKQLYKDYKLSQSYLLRGTNHDAVSGWLLLATLFYRIKQYRKALEIVYYALTKCSQEKWLKDSKLSCANREVLKTKLLQSKGLIDVLKLLRTEEVRLEMNSTLVPNELEPEISRLRLFVAPVVYAHFLSLLCHFHLRDVRQTRESLYYLSHTIFPNCKSLTSLNCLGAALQLIGWNDLAKQTFQRIFQLDPFCFNSCAEVRLCMIDAK